MRRQRLTDRVRALETQETLVVEHGNGPPTHKSYPVTMYYDVTNKDVYLCVATGGGAGAWKKIT